MMWQWKKLGRDEEIERSASSVARYTRSPIHLKKQIESLKGDWNNKRDTLKRRPKRKPEKNSDIILIRQAIN